LAKKNSESFVDRVKRAGCWAVGLYIFAIFFTLGALVSLINLDFMRAIGGVVIAAICVGLGIWLARKGIGR
jgi:hypothetical protein